MTVEEHINVFHRHVELLSYLGVTITAKGKKRTFSSLIWFLIVEFTIVLNSIVLLLTIQHRSDTLAMKSLSLIFFLISVVSGIKLLLIQINSKMLAKLFEELDTPGASQSTKMLHKTHNISRIYTVCLFGLLLGWLAYPWMTGTLTLPIPYWLPFEIDSFIHFTFAYGFVSFAFTIICYTQDAVDTLFLLIGGQICRRFDSIRNALATVGSEEPLIKKTWKRGKEIEDRLGLSIIRVAVLSRDETLLRECIREHGDVISLVRTFDKVLDNIYLAQVLQSTIVSTMSLFALSKSDALHRTLYLSKWYKCREKIMKSLVIMETFTKTHFKLEGGHLFNIDLKTFILVLKESFSYFMVLRAITNKTSNSDEK